MPKLLLALSLVVSTSFACTTFLLSDGTKTFFGKNYDWSQGHGLMAVNKRNVEKTALLLDQTQTPAVWTSKFGSVTFNQQGREFPLGGINEEGLAVEIMWLTDSTYPGPDMTPAINELQWIQYQLDNYATTAQVVADAHKIRISDVAAPVHYMVCDKSADCATFEYIGGKMVVHSGSGVSVKVLTNDTYDGSVRYLSQYLGFGGTKPIPAGFSSLHRFVRAASLVNALSTSITSAFDVLKSTKVSLATQWKIVYGVHDGSIEFYQRPDFKRSRSLQIAGFDFSCKTPVQVYDLNDKHRGDITKRFVDYSAELNHQVIAESAEEVTELKPLVDLMAAYPDATICTE